MNDKITDEIEIGLPLLDKVLPIGGVPRKPYGTTTTYGRLSAAPTDRNLNGFH